jgi:nucleotide-binding universal stress UspA family protein
MYKKVLVPLDGSELAECALPHIISLAKDGAIGEVILFSAVEMEIPLAFTTSDDMRSIEGVDFQAIWDEQVEKSNKYLAAIESRLTSEGIKSKAVLAKGVRSAQAIIEFSQKNNIDLIIIATHGYTGMKKLLMGSVAFKVLHESRVPVLLIRATS